MKSCKEGSSPYLLIPYGGHLRSQHWLDVILPCHNLSSWILWSHRPYHRYRYKLPHHTSPHRGQYQNINVALKPAASISAQFPSGLDFIELGRYAPAGLTSSGDLYYNGEWVASGIRCFDAVYNSVIAADSSGTLLAFGSGPIAQEPLPSTGSVAVQDIQLTYPFSASAATRAYALLDDGTVNWWPTYPAGNGDSYIEGQDQIPYAASQLANIEEIAAGADALYARDGYMHISFLLVSTTSVLRASATLHLWNLDANDTSYAIKLHLAL